MKNLVSRFSASFIVSVLMISGAALADQTSATAPSNSLRSFQIQHCAPPSRHVSTGAPSQCHGFVGRFILSQAAPTCLQGQCYNWSCHCCVSC
jgi:hypothetical protein